MMKDFSMIGAIAASRSYGSFVGHDEQSGVFRTVVSGELCWLVAQRPWCVLQSCGEWRAWVVYASRRYSVVLLEGVIDVNVLDLILMRSPYQRVLWGLFVIGLSACTF